MKKELLLATAVAGLAVGATSASAVTSTLSGNHRVGLLDQDRDSSTATTGTTAENIQSSFAVALEETTDAGTKIAGSFTIMSEGSAFKNSPSGITLTFTDGSSLELVSGGNASKDHDVAVPNVSGEMALGQSSSNSAAVGIDGVGANNAIGFAWHSAADVGGIDGASISISYSNGDETAVATGTSKVDSSWSVGATYVTTTGDTTVTLGAGLIEASDDNTTTKTDYSVYHIGAVAVNGDLTVGLGMGAGDYPDGTTSSTNEVIDWEAVEAGISYVSGDLTFTAVYRDSDSIDGTAGTTPSGVKDGLERTGLSIDYAVASGVTTTIGFLNQSASNEGTKEQTNSGSSWYIGSNLSF